MQMVLNRASSRNFTIVEAYYTGRRKAAPTLGDVALERRSDPGGDRTGAQFAFGLQPVLEIASVRGTGGEEQLVRAVGDIGVGQN